MTAYDKLDWNHDSAVAAGQPPENALAHIGFYLAWLIRHDLHRPRAFPAAHLAAVGSGEMTGSDLADDIEPRAPAHPATATDGWPGASRRTALAGAATVA